MAIRHLSASFLLLAIAASARGLPTRDLGGATASAVGQATMRYRRVFRLYEASLFLTDPNHASRVLDPDVPKRLEVTYLRDLDLARVNAAGRDFLRDRLNADTFAAIAEDLRRMEAAFPETLRDGDVCALIYLPGQGLTLEYNGTAKVNIASPAFAAAYLSIWLGDPSVSPAFTRELLGR